MGVSTMEGAASAAGRRDGAGAVPTSGRWPLFGAAALLATAAAQVAGFALSPADRDMGHLQKIMYVHVPTAWVAFVAFAIVAVASFLVLVRHDDRWDLLAAASAEVGAVMTALTLVLGAVWGRPTWGVWWTWDARLTSTAVLLLIFIGYLARRAFVDEPQRRAQWSAAVGLLGALNVPIVYMSVRWWRTLHQVQSSPRTLDPGYQVALLLNSVAVLLLTIYLIRQRWLALRLTRAAEHAAEVAALGGRS